MKSCLVVIGTLSVILTVIFYMTFTGGYVLSMLWLWYAVPLGFKAVSWQAFSMLSAALYIVRPSLTDNSKTPPMQAAGYLLSPWLVLLTGWLLK